MRANQSSARSDPMMDFMEALLRESLYMAAEHEADAPSSSVRPARRHVVELVPDDEGDCCDRRCVGWIRQIGRFFDRHRMLCSVTAGSLLTSPLTLIGVGFWASDTARDVGMGLALSGFALGVALGPLIFCVRHVLDQPAPPQPATGYGTYA
ncbi:hypothetical protein J5T34_01050 [Cupriavidus gilardii]|uniref:hypothetical protein n=1 Tax=Cupriavidus gilardii TaxID=82541 RepID=UPI001ABE8AA0|nr:hypothetical protein [Cupriavidus gilardii]MBO4119321.1 hypothetical protein [Cupriavidus gilardii]